MGYGNGYAPAQGAAGGPVTGAAVTGCSPASAELHDTLTLTGSGLTGATSVKVGGVSATFSVVDDETITATMPYLPGASGAKTVEVTAPLSLAAAVNWVAPTLWTPSVIGTDFWLKSDVGITESGGAVSSWADQSGAGLDVSQASASSQPTYGATSFNSAFPGVTFAQDYLTRTTSGSPSSNRTYCFAIDVTSYPAWDYLFDASTDRPTVFTMYSGSPTKGWAWGSSAASGQQPTGAAIVSIGFETNGEMFVNGTAVYSPTFTQAALSLDGTMVVGGKHDSTAGWHGVLAEMFLTSAPVSAADRQRCEGYLAHRLGLTANLPASHPYKSAPPTV